MRSILITIVFLMETSHFLPVLGEFQVLNDISTNSSTSKTEQPQGLGFFHGFIASLSMIVVSEIGDKTFFIAAIMSMKHSRLTVFIGAISALALMTVLSVVFGYAATIIPRVYTYYISTALFAIFGLKMLREGCKMSPTEGQEELEEVQTDLRKRDEEFEAAEKHIEGVQVSDKHPSLLDDKFERGGIGSDLETGISSKKQSNVFFVVSRIILQAFSLTFLAEWGDRSQLATIILSARENVYGVTVGGILGHSICTGVAVIGGRLIAQKISVRTVMIIGGVVFLIFAFSALIVDPS